MQVSDTTSMSANAAASATGAAGNSRNDGPSFQDLLSQLQDFGSGNIADAMNSEILAQLGITKEQLAQMPPEERAKVEEKVRELMKKELTEKVNQNLQAEQQAQMQQPGTATAMAAGTGAQSGGSASQHRPRSIDIMV
ncbi:hypothetical protein GCM10027093_24690 [Paraburkholderia jirisanensis]